MCDESVGDGHFAGEQLSENVEEVFIVNLPVVPATRFACHLCTDHAQNLSSLEGLKKKHFKRKHQNSIIIRFQCRQCELPLRGIKTSVCMQNPARLIRHHLMQVPAQHLLLVVSRQPKFTDLYQIYVHVLLPSVLIHFRL